MMHTRLVVKRRDNDKEVSRYKAIHQQLIAVHLTVNDLGGGIIDALLPQCKEEWDLLLDRKKNLYVKEAFVRQSDRANARKAARSKSFLKDIGQWLLQRDTNWRAVGIVSLAKLIEREHKKIRDTLPSRDQFLEAVLYKHQLLDVKRRHGWWEEQFAAAK
jgi:hypothetical protein